MATEMGPAITTGFFTLGGVLITSIVNYISNRRQQDRERLQNELSRLRTKFVAACQQIEAYYELERLYAEELSKSQDKKKGTVVIEFRNRIEENGFERPQWTASDAKKAIKDTQT